MAPKSLDEILAPAFTSPEPDPAPQKQDRLGQLMDTAAAGAPEIKPSPGLLVALLGVF